MRMPSLFALTFVAIWPQLSLGQLVAPQFEGCCQDRDESITSEWYCVDGAAFYNETGFLFMVKQHIAIRFRPDHYSEVLLDQSVQSMADWDFAYQTNNSWFSSLIGWFISKQQNVEVKAAVGLQDGVVIKRSENYFLFQEVRGRAVEAFLDCMDLNSSLCSNDKEQLEAVASYWGSLGDRYMQVFHFQPDNSKKLYRVTMSKGSEVWTTFELTDQDNTIDAIIGYKHNVGTETNEKYIYSLDDHESCDRILNHGVYFNLDGFTCPFDIDSEKLDARQAIKVIHSASKRWMPHAGCYPTTALLGCPLLWGYNSDIGDMATVKLLLGDDSQFNEKVFAYRGHYYWEFEASGLPLAIGSSQLLKTSNYKSNNALCLPYIDAIEDFSIERGFFIIIWKDRALYFFNGATDKGEMHVHQRDWRYPSSSELDQQLDLYSNLNVFLPELVCAIVDALWYNKFETKLYVFCGERYQVYPVSYDRSIQLPRFITDGKYKLIEDTWKGVEPNLDGVLTVGSRTRFLKGQGFWMLGGLKRGHNGQTSSRMHKYLSMGTAQKDLKGAKSKGLFAAKEKCDYSDEYQAIVKQFSELGYGAYLDQAAARMANGGLSKFKFNYYLCLVIFLLFIVAFALLIFYAFGCKERVRIRKLHREVSLGSK